MSAYTPLLHDYREEKIYLSHLIENLRKQIRELDIENAELKKELSALKTKHQPYKKKDKNDYYGTK